MYFTEHRQWSSFYRKTGGNTWLEAIISGQVLNRLGLSIKMAIDVFTIPTSISGL